MQIDYELPLPEIIVGDRDFSTIEWILDETLREKFSTAGLMLERELDRAKVVPTSDIPASVVRVGTHFLYRDHELGVTKAGTLVLPGLARYGDDNISILTLLGAALLGLSEGQSISIRTLDDRIRTISVLKVLSQPEHR